MLFQGRSSLQTWYLQENLKCDATHMNKMADSLVQCQNMDDLKEQNLKQLMEIDRLHTKLMVLTQKEIKADAEQSRWRERERFLEGKLSEYETKGLAAQNVGRFSLDLSTAEMETQTEETAQTYHEREQKLTNLYKETADLKDAAQMRNSQMQNWNEKQVKSETDGSNDDRELEANTGDYKREGSRLEKEVSEAADPTTVEIGGEPLGAGCGKQFVNAPDVTGYLQKAVESLQQQLKVSKERYSKEERAKLSLRQKEQDAKLKQLENEQRHLGEAPLERKRTQSDTKEIKIQTDLTMDMMREDAEDMQEDVDELLDTLRMAEIKFNKEKKELEKRATDCETELKAAQEQLATKESAMQKAQEEWSLEKEKALQSDCTELKELKESLEDSLAMYETMAQRHITLQQEYQSLQKTVEALEKELVYKEKQFQTELSINKSQMLKDVGDMQREKAELKALMESTWEQFLQQQNALKEECEQLTEQRTQEGNEDGAHEATVSELRRALQEEAALRDSLHRLHWETERAWIKRRAGWEDEKANLVNQINQLYQEKIRLLAMYEEEKEKTTLLEEIAEASQERREENMKMERYYKQQLELQEKREDEAINWISELTDTKDQLEKELQEAHEKENSWSLREQQWNEAKDKLLHQIEYLMAVNHFHERKKERKGFFSRLFGKSH